MAKIECPICNTIGFLEQRGNSYRIKHYLGFEEGKRKYKVHTITKEQLESLGINGNQSMGIKNLESSLISKIQWTGGDLNPRPLECKSSVHAS
jgi:hypothetical protein